MSEENIDKEPSGKEVPKEEKPANADTPGQDDMQRIEQSLTPTNPYNYPKPPTNVSDKPAFLFKPGVLEPKPSQDTTKPVPASLDPGPSSSSTMVPGKLDQPKEDSLGVDHPLFVDRQVEEPVHNQIVNPAEEHPLGVEQLDPAEDPLSVDQPFPVADHPLSVDQPDPAQYHPLGVDQRVLAEDHPLGVDQPDPAEDHPLDIDQPGPAEDYHLDVDQPDPAEDHPLGVDQPGPADEQAEASTSGVTDQAAGDSDDEPNPLMELADTLLQCPICMEVYIMATSTNCGHTFCQDCIVDWRKKNKLCPVHVCRTRIKHVAPSTALDQFIAEMFGMMDQEGLQRRREFVLERGQKRELCGKKKKK